MSTTINERISIYRKLANLTQAEVAEKLGMKCSTYSQMERRGTISAERLMDLANIFGVKPQILFYGEQAEQMTPIVNKEPIVRQSINEGPAPFIPTGKEENIIKILRSLPKSDFNDILDYINTKYQSSKNK